MHLKNPYTNFCIPPPMTKCADLKQLFPITDELIWMCGTLLEKVLHWYPVGKGITQS